ncbi:MAG: DUF4430 domain-containing protein [Lachnospiraceae bacterium]|nr:DUF4430 domain-containing protein [Lachnospiraceae bacterium]
MNMWDKIRDFIREKRNIKKIAVGAIVIITAVVIITQISIESASVDSNQPNVSVSNDTASTQGAKSDKDKKDNKTVDSSDATDKESKDESKTDESKNDESKKDKSQTAQSQKNETQKDSTAENKSAAGNSSNSGNSVATGSADNNSGNSKTQTNTSESGSNEPQQVREPKVVNCTVTIDCSSISGNGALTAAGNPQLEAYAANPTILSVNINVSDTNDDGRVGVDEAIKQACDAYGIQYEFKSSSYLSGMNYLYEFNAGPNSGWMYKVNGRVPNKGCNSYYLNGSEDVLWYYVISY